jgi:glycerate kinase
MPARPPVFVLAPDSFKGALDAPGVCAALATGLRRVWPDVEVRARPMADGGEGTLDTVLAASGNTATRHELAVPGATGDIVRAAYGILGSGADRIAVIEIATVVPITDLSAMARDVFSRDTRGVGALLRTLIDDGVRRFMVGLGGSSTNDGGAGMLASLGLALADRNGAAIAPTPTGLAELATVDAASLDPRLVGCSITLMSDVNNPLCGELGATAVFGPQKGVRPDAIEVVDRRLARFAELAEKAVGREAAGSPGAGAAGGLGFALQLIGAEARSGSSVVADLIGLDAALDGADWALTGEGRSDRQTLLAKAPFAVAQRARARRVPVTLVSGAVDAAALPALGEMFAGAFALAPGPMDLATSIARTGELLADRAEQLGRVIAAARIG